MRRILDLSVLCLVGGLVSGCLPAGVTDSEVIPTAGVRFINAVPDTGGAFGLDFRFIDIVENSDTYRATFRNNPITSANVTASSNIQYKNAKARVMELGDQMIKDARSRYAATRPENRNLIDDIMAAHIETPEKMPASDLILSLTGPYVAGLDTVANTTSTVVYTVLKHPEVKARVQKEVDALFAAGDVDEEGLLQKLPALSGAIMETMRLYPIAVAQMRTANKDFVFEGHQIHEGEMIYVGTSVPHFLDEYWPNATTFDIDRYQKPRAEHLQPGVYSPYGRGPHTCLGKSLAEVQMALSMARVFHKLDLELESPRYVLKTKTAPTPGPAMSFKVRVNGYRH